jgi:hypothetical protein
MDAPINNIIDLRLEIVRLKGLEVEQSYAISQRFKSPGAILSTFFSLFSGTPSADGTKSAGFWDQDFVGLISRFLLPFTLNKTLFRNSNFLIKAIVGLVSQKASHFITEDSVMGLWDKVKSLFDKDDKHEQADHKGVPPLSETY